MEIGCHMSRLQAQDLAQQRFGRFDSLQIQQYVGFIPETVHVRGRIGDALVDTREAMMKRRGAGVALSPLRSDLLAPVELDVATNFLQRLAQQLIARTRLRRRRRGGKATLRHTLGKPSERSQAVRQARVRVGIAGGKSEGLFDPAEAVLGRGSRAQAIAETLKDAVRW